MAGKIKKVWGEVIHDSRGDETLQVNIESDSGAVSSSAVPAGASRGAFEAKPINPNDSVKIIDNTYSKKLIGMELGGQKELDAMLIKEDGSPDKARLGANTILGISMAYCRASANEIKQPLYKYIASLSDRTQYKIPVPMMNLINGGKHADNNLDIQEFMIVPNGVKDYHSQLSAGKMIFSTIGQLVKASTPFVPIGDEGGYAPSLDTNEMALGYLLEGVRQSGYQTGSEVNLALDVAASSLPSTFETSLDRYLGFLDDFPIISLEDPFPEEEWAKWSDFMKRLEGWNTSARTVMIVGDDLYATNKQRLLKGIGQKASNAILIKLNQAGSVSETVDVVETAHKAGFITIVSHRSGETLDDFIADFAVGMGSQFIKTGAPNDTHPERITKYRRLLQIEKELIPTTDGSDKSS